MDDAIRSALDQMPEKSRSKLEPHADIIRELRRKGRTYEEIAQFFAERLNLKVAPSTIHAFVRVRARRRQRTRIELSSSLEYASPGTSETEVVTRRIAELKRRRPPDAENQPRFEYDEN